MQFQSSSLSPQTQGQYMKTLLMDQEKQMYAQEVFCKLCQGVLIQPWDCRHCENVFCKDCILDYVKKNQSNCLCGKPFELQDPHKIVLKILSRLKFHCPLQKQGCQEILLYDNFSSHLCQFKMLRCPNEKCELQVVRMSYDQHVIDCQFKKMNCEFCNDIFYQSNLKSHQDNCPFKIISCEGCKQSLCLKDKEEHYALCDFILVECDQCNSQQSKRDKREHTEEKCLYIFYENNVEVIEQKIQQVQKLIQYLGVWLQEQESVFGTKCSVCQWLVCEVSRQNCLQCNKVFCSNCQKKSFKECIECQTKFCNSCLQSGQYCHLCSENRRNQPEDLDQDYDLQRRQRGRPRKSNTINQYVID